MPRLVFSLTVRFLYNLQTTGETRYDPWEEEKEGGEGKREKKGQKRREIGCERSSSCFGSSLPHSIGEDQTTKKERGGEGGAREERGGGKGKGFTLC